MTRRRGPSSRASVMIAREPNRKRNPRSLKYLVGEAKRTYAAKETGIGKEDWNRLQRLLLLQSLDTLWMNHLDEIDYLRQGIGLRGLWPARSLD